MVPLLFPICVSHKIDETSPLYEIDPQELETIKLEIIISVSGVRSEINLILESYYEMFNMYTYIYLKSIGFNTIRFHRVFSIISSQE